MTTISNKDKNPSGIFDYSGDPTREITKAYQTYLGRQPDQPGMDYYLNQVQSGNSSLEQSINEIRQSQERNRVGTITGSNLGESVSGATSERTRAAGETVLGNLTEPNIPAGAEQTYTPLEIGEDEVVSPTDDRFQIGSQRGVGATTGTAADKVGTRGTTTSTYDPTLIGQGAAGTEQAARLDQLTAAARAAAATGELPEEAMVRYQMDELLAGIENGDIPAWAQPAVDQVEGQLAARGLSRSSVGQASLTNAIITAAFPIAQADAQAIATNFMQDKAAQTQVSMFNATAEQQLVFQNLANEQQMAMMNVQLRQQAMLSDQAASNAAQQFNAASENQTNQFMSNLRATVDMNNAARLDAMAQFNAGQQNSIAQFNANMQYQRDQFNAQNATAIEQSNLQWRRQVNQLNTAGVNAVNQANAMNAFNLSNQALTFMWQEMRDAAQWSFEAAQNEEQRKATLALAALGNDAAADANNQKYIAAMGAAAVNLWQEMKGA